MQRNEDGTAATTDDDTGLEAPPHVTIPAYALLAVVVVLGLAVGSLGILAAVALVYAWIA